MKNRSLIMKARKKFRVDSRSLGWFERTFGTVKCIGCGARMKEQPNPYGRVYQCPRCGWLTFHNPK